MDGFSGDDRRAHLLSPLEEAQFAGLVEAYYATPDTAPGHDPIAISGDHRVVLTVGVCMVASCGMVILSIWLVEHGDPVVVLLGIGTAAVLAALTVAGLMIATRVLGNGWPRGDDHS